MDSKTLIKALKIAVREVIKEELTDILREGLQSTITEMTQPKKRIQIVLRHKQLKRNQFNLMKKKIGKKFMN